MAYTRKSTGSAGRVTGPKQPTNPMIFEWRPRTVGPKQDTVGDWEKELQRMANGTPMPTVYEPLPTTSRLRLKRRAMAQEAFKSPETNGKAE